MNQGEKRGLPPIVDRGKFSVPVGLDYEDILIWRGVKIGFVTAVAIYLLVPFDARSDANLIWSAAGVSSVLAMLFVGLHKFAKRRVSGDDDSKPFTHGSRQTVLRFVYATVIGMQGFMVPIGVLIIVSVLLKD